MLASCVDGDHRTRGARIPVAYAGEIRGVAQRCGGVGEPASDPGLVHALSRAAGRRSGGCGRGGCVVRRNPTSGKTGQKWSTPFSDLLAGKYELISVGVFEDC